MEEPERAGHREQEPDSSESFELAMRAGEEAGAYVLCLYVSGTTPNSRRAIENVRRICEEYLPGRYELEIVDIYQQQSHVKDGQIVAAPTLVKKSPLPSRKFVGNMSKIEKLLAGLGLRPKE